MDVIKQEIRQYLEKSGSSLEEFESTLQSINTAEGAIKFASLSKEALIGEILNAGKEGLGFAGNLVGGIADLGVLGTAGIGTGLGAGALAIDRHLRNQDKKQKEREGDVTRMKDLIKRLKETNK